MAKLTTVVASDLTHIVATFNADMDPASLNGRTNWTCTRSTVGAMQAEVIDAVVQNGDRVVHIVVGPGMSPNETYTLEAINAEDALGNILPEVDRELAFVAPSVLADTEVPYSPLMNIEATTLAVAETLQQRAGPAATFLLQPLGASDTTAVVESTLDFPASGAFFVGGLRFTYTSIGQMTFYGVAVDPSYGWNDVPVAQYSLLTGDIKTGDTTVFAYEQALRDTVFTTSDGLTFDQLMSMYGVARPQQTAIAQWRQAAQAVVWNVRGSLGSMFEFLYRGLPKTTIAVNLDPTKPQALGGTWTEEHISRLFRYDGAVYWSVGITSGDLMLCPVATGWWNRADFSTLPAPATVDFELLSWTFDAGGGRFRVYIEDAAIEVPPTYLSAVADFGASAMAATPSLTRWLWMFGGPVEYFDPSFTEPATNGLLTGVAIPNDWAGTWRDITFSDQRTSPSRGGTYTARLYVNGSVAATVILGATATTAQSVGTVTIAPNDLVAVEITANAGVTQALIQPRVALSIDNASGQADSGYITADDSITDPLPLYLGSTEYDEVFTSTMKGLLAAGVWGETRLVDFLTRAGF